jgi:DNA-binding MarR family transcriptional regulator
MSEDKGESVLRSLRRISRAIDLYSRHLAKHYRLTGPQLVCLRAISAGPLCASDLAREVSLSKATVTGILDRLEGRDLVRRTRSTDDRRRVLLVLTPAGCELLKRVPTPLQQRFAAHLSALPGDDQAVMDEVLKRIVAMMEAEDLDVAPLLAAGPADTTAGSVLEFLVQGDAAAGETTPPAPGGPQEEREA